jgi:hypothetical protein
MTLWPPPVYEMDVEFDAPIAFVYRWCTDYSARDGALSGEPYERRIVSRSKRRVVLEDLWWEPDGWRWRRSDVTLRPPMGWRADSVGNIRDARIDYRLTAPGEERTHLHIRMLRRPGSRSNGQPPKRAFERQVEAMWRRLARHLEHDYRRAGRARPRPRRGRRALSRTGTSRRTGRAASSR